MTQSFLSDGVKPFSYKKEDRLLWRSRYLQVQNLARRVHTSYFILFLLPNDLGRIRLGITASRKVGSAVVRNRVKRRVREAFRTNRDVFPPSSDVVVVAKRESAQADMKTIMADLERGGLRLRRR